MAKQRSTFYEFFAGAGMARAGLGSKWECLFANDFDRKKAATYQNNWGQDHLLCGDIKKISPKDLPSQADLVWASFPCQDLSLAGGGAGLKGERSGTFWPFWSLMTKLTNQGRAPSLVVLENVCGTLTSHKGKDFVAICKSLNDGGYKFGALVIDAVRFVPQSRPRLFVIAVKEDAYIPDNLVRSDPEPEFHPQMLKTAFERLPSKLMDSWIWWQLKSPPVRKNNFVDLIEDDPTSVTWHTQEQTRKLLAMMSEINLEKVREAKREGHRMVGAVYKRTRRDANNLKIQRAEVRFDDVAGCLRTPAGGSSRQLILVVEGRKVRSRLISSRETARLMGLPDSYALPKNYNEAYHLTGDGVVVPVVRHLARGILDPIVQAQLLDLREAA